MTSIVGQAWIVPNLPDAEKISAARGWASRCVTASGPPATTL